MIVASLTIDTSRSGRSRAELVWAGLYLDIGGWAFPNVDWTDFAIVVVGWWVDALMPILRGESRHAEIMFMEGPFSVEIKTVDDEAWQIECIERGLRRTALQTVVVDAVKLAESVVACAESALALCRENGWWAADSSDLENRVHKLKRQMKKT